MISFSEEQPSRLLLQLFAVSNLQDDAYPSALAIGDVRGVTFTAVVPEPASLTLPVVGVLGTMGPVCLRRPRAT
jgi:hypothetical protein